jgi:hypothetical protein
MHERCVEIVESSESVAVAFERGLYEADFDRRRFGGQFGSGWGQWIHEKQVGSRHDTD